MAAVTVGDATALTLSLLGLGALLATSALWFSAGIWTLLARRPLHSSGRAVHFCNRLEAKAESDSV